MALSDRSSGAGAGASVPPEEVQAVLATRTDLGPHYELELAESFADRVEQVIEARVAERTSASKGLERALERAGQGQMVLGIVSLGTAPGPGSETDTQDDQPWRRWRTLAMLKAP
jgi:hypothetical protein